MAMKFAKVPSFRDAEQFREHLRTLSGDLPMDERVLSEADHSPLAEPMKVGDFTVGNRWCIHPMEGWDAERDGSPSEHTLRRWRHFGISGFPRVVDQFQMRQWLFLQDGVDRSGITVSHYDC